ncbi:MAG: hypothetical protein AAGF32_08920, partial [Pseudomonadota bacterium]
MELPIQRRQALNPVPPSVPPVSSATPEDDGLLSYLMSFLPEQNDVTALFGNSGQPAAAQSVGSAEAVRARITRLEQQLDNINNQVSRSRSGYEREGLQNQATKLADQIAQLEAEAVTAGLPLRQADPASARALQAGAVALGLTPSASRNVLRYAGRRSAANDARTGAANAETALRNGGDGLTLVSETARAQRGVDGIDAIENAPRTFSSIAGDIADKTAAVGGVGTATVAPELADVLAHGASSEQGQAAINEVFRLDQIPQRALIAASGALGPTVLDAAQQMLPRGNIPTDRINVLSDVVNRGSPEDIHRGVGTLASQDASLREYARLSDEQSRLLGLNKARAASDAATIEAALPNNIDRMRENASFAGARRGRIEDTLDEADAFPLSNLFADPPAQPTTHPLSQSVQSSGSPGDAARTINIQSDVSQPRAQAEQIANIDRRPERLKNTSPRIQQKSRNEAGARVLEHMAGSDTRVSDAIKAVKQADADGVSEIAEKLGLPRTTSRNQLIGKNGILTRLRRQV